MKESPIVKQWTLGHKKSINQIESVFLLHLANVKELNMEPGNSCDAFPSKISGADFSHDRQNYSPNRKITD